MNVFCKSNRAVGGGKKSHIKKPHVKSLTWGDICLGGPGAAWLKRKKNEKKGGEKSTKRRMRKREYDFEGTD